MDKSTKVLLGNKAREAILRGVNQIYDPVRLTLGPEGGNSLMYRTYGRGPRITNDGVTISEVIEPIDEFENLAAGAFKEASKRTNERVGDGTTSTIVIGGKLINEVFSKLSDSSDIRSKTAGGQVGVMKLKKEMIEIGTRVEEEISKVAKKVTKVEELVKIATVSVEDPTIGKTVAEMVWETGVEGFIDVIEGHKQEIETEVIHGMRFPAKTAAKVFVNKPDRFEMVLQDYHVVVCNYAIDNASAISFTKSLNTSKLVIFAPSFHESVLIGMINAHKQGFFIYPVRTPALRTDQYEDLATYCGATFINKDTGKKMANIAEHDLGFVEKLIVKDSDNREDAVATGGKGAKTGAIKERIEILKGQMEETKQDIHKKLLERRIASMASAIGLIKVGAPSTAEGLYLLKKIEDAVYAAKAALEEGYVEGGGMCLKKIAEAMEPNILTSALMAPYEQIQANAEATESNPLKIGKDIIDPAKVVRLSVGHAVSVVAHLATVKIMIPEVRDRNPAEGYSDIAKAIARYTTYWAKQQGLIKESEMELAMENEQNFNENLMRSEGN